MYSKPFLLYPSVVRGFAWVKHNNPEVADMADEFRRLPERLDDYMALHFIGMAAKWSAFLAGAGFHMSLTLEDATSPSPSPRPSEGAHRVPVFLHVPCAHTMDRMFREDVEKCAGEEGGVREVRWEEPCTLKAVLDMNVASPDPEEVERELRAFLTPCLMRSYLNALQKRSDERYEDLTVYVAIGDATRCVLRADEALRRAKEDGVCGPENGVVPRAPSVWRELRAFIRARTPQLDRELVGARLAKHVRRRELVDLLQSVVDYLWKEETHGQHEHVRVHQEREMYAYVEDRMNDPQVMKKRGGKASRRRKFARDWMAKMEKKNVRVCVQIPSFAGSA